MKSSFSWRALRLCVNLDLAKSQRKLRAKKMIKLTPGMFKWRRALLCLPIAAVLIAISLSVSAVAQQPAQEVSKQFARPARDWVRDGVIYEIYPRDFSPE